MGKSLKRMLAAAALSALPLMAQAADVAVPARGPAPFTWTGWYVGINAGYAWGESDMQTISTGAGYFAAVSRAQFNSIGVREIDSDGWTAGVQIGYLHQYGTGPFGGNFVLGVEADAGYLGLKGSSTVGPIAYTCCVGAFTHTGSFETDWLLSLRGKYGVAYGNWLFFSTAGFAVTRVESRFAFSDTFGTGAVASASGHDWAGGIVTGFGVETMLWQKWTLRAEYLHYRFTNVSIISNNLVFGGAPFPGEFFSHSTDLRADVVRAALNYKL
jgi:outer membrane immunogenic protein